MKFDPAKRTDIGTARTLKALKDALTGLLAASAFEDVTIQKICEESMIPRSTFYNYFDDKYDLLEYVFDTLSADMFGGAVGYSFEGLLAGTKYAFSLIDANRTKIDQILKRNGEGGWFYHALQMKFFCKMKESFLDCPHSTALIFSPELTACFCASALWSLLDLKFNSQLPLTTEDAEKFLLAAINYEGLGMRYGG